jgi:hypothetical protein
MNRNTDLAVGNSRRAVDGPVNAENVVKKILTSELAWAHAKAGDHRPGM